MISAVPATPELLAKIDALPPAADEPDIPDSLSHAADPQFGLRNLIRPVQRVMLIGFALVGVDTVLQLLAPALVRTGIDQGVTGNDSRILFGASAVVLLLIVADFFVSRISQLVTGRTGERLLYLLRVKTFAHLQRLGLDYYEREMGGRIITRMTTDVDALSNFLQTGLVTTLVSVLTLVGVLIALLVLDAGLSLILVVDAARHRGGDVAVPPPGRAGLQAVARAGQRRQRPAAGERRRRAGDPGLRTRGSQRRAVPRFGQRVPRVAAAGPDLHLDLLPVHPVPVRPRRRDRARRRGDPTARRHRSRPAR